MSIEGTVNNPILLTNSYPFSLVRREAIIDLVDMEEIRQLCRQSRIVSAWGHENTLNAVSNQLQVDVTPPVERPVIALNANALPVLENIVFDCVYIISPDYVPGYRPETGVQVPEEKITGWTVLKLSFTERTNS